MTGSPRTSPRLDNDKNQRESQDLKTLSDRIMKECSFESRGKEIDADEAADQEGLISPEPDTTQSRWVEKIRKSNSVKTTTNPVTFSSAESISEIKIFKWCYDYFNI